MLMSCGLMYQTTEDARHRMHSFLLCAQCPRYCVVVSLCSFHASRKHTHCLCLAVQHTAPCIALCAVVPYLHRLCHDLPIRFAKCGT